MGYLVFVIAVLSLGREDIVTGLVSHMRPSCEDSDRLDGQIGCLFKYD